jgi:hypothetical protein
MCTIKDADAFHHTYMMRSIEFQKSEQSLDGFLKTRNIEQLKRIVKHAKEKTKHVLVEKAQAELDEQLRLTSDWTNN